MDRIRATAGAAGGPDDGGEGQRTRVPSRRAGALHSGDQPQAGEVTVLPPIPPENAPLSEYKGTSLKSIGLDSKGRVIQHQRSEKVARQIGVWMLGGYSENDVCIALNIRPGKLRELYGREINHGADLMGMDMTSHIVKRAKQSDRMAIFVAKSRMNWRDGDGKPTDTGVLNIVIHN